MGVYEGRGQLTKSMKELLAKWTDLRGGWDDPRSRAFEEKFLFHMQQDLKNAVGAMDQMAILLEQAKRDCT